MRRIVTLLVLASIAALPARSEAAEPCTALTDPVDDVEFTGSLGFVSPDGERPADPQTSAVENATVAKGRAGVDIRSIEAMRSGSALGFTIRVRDLRAPLPPGGYAYYMIFWKQREGLRAVRADRLPAGWRFRADKDSRVPNDGERDARGSADPRASTITIHSPYPIHGSAWEIEIEAATVGTPHALLLGETPHALLIGQRHTTDTAFVHSDSAPNVGEGPGLSTAGECTRAPGSTDPGVRCVVARDARGDNFYPELVLPPMREPSDPAVDLVSLQLGASSDTLAFDIQVADLGRQQADRQMWTISWEHGNHDAHDDARIEVVRTKGGLRADYNEPWPYNDFAHRAVVREDPGADQILVLVPLKRFRLRTGSLLQDVMVGAHSTKSGFYHGLDWFSPAADFVVGESCAEQARLQCPVVMDRRRDVTRSIGRRSLTRGLDVRAVGAKADRDTVTLTARVRGAPGRPPAGFTTMGWTVTASTGSGALVAQAERTRSGDRFRFRRLGPLTRPAGPISGGTATTGSISGTLIRIRVPRDAAGLPPDGAIVRRVGAASWVMASGPGVAAWVRADRTRARPWLMGVSCEA